MDKKITISHKFFYGAALSFLSLPVIIFFLGFLKIYIGIILSLLLIGGCFLALKDIYKNPEGKLVSKTEIKVPLKFIIVISVFSILVSLGTGVGEFVWTTYDHAFRRAMLRDLIDYSWPVIYSPETQTNEYVVQIINMSSNALYVYYLCYWLPAAVVGKIFGFAAGNIFLVIWNSFGIFITLIGMALYCKRATYSTIFTFLCFSGLDVIPYYVYNFTNYGDWWWIEGYVTNMSLISNINSLMNIYNQCIPCWLIVVMIMLSLNNRSIGLYGSLLFAYTPWGTIGLLPIAIIKLFQKKMAATDIRKKLSNIFTLQNIIPAVIMLICFGGFFLLKSDATGQRGFTVTFFDTVGHFVVSYLVLILVEVVPVFILLIKRQKRNPIFWGAIITLLIMPFYKITEQNDFLMRGAMAALFVLCLLLTQKISEITAEEKLLRMKKAKRKAKESIKLALVFLTLLGMAYMTYFMGTVVMAATIANLERPDNDIVSFGNIAKPDYAEKIEDQFFVYDYENQAFYKYFLK